MKILSSLLILFMFIVSLSSNAQKLEEEVLNYEYTQNPSNPIEGLESYDFTVSTPYPENTDGLIEYAKTNHEKAVAEHPAKVAEAKRIHEERLASYDEDVALAQENYRLEQEAFKNLSKFERLAAEGDDRPQLRMPSKPGAFIPPNEPVYRDPNTSDAITFKGEALADTYLNLEGFAKGGDNALVGTVEMGEFDAGETQSIESVKRVYNKDTKQHTDQKTYTYETPIKRPTRLTLEFNGESLFNDIFEGTGDYTTVSGKSHPNMLRVEKDNIGDILANINSYINEQYGYAKVPATLVIRAPKNKGDFDDLEKAMKLAKRGINPMGSSDGVSELAEALQIWETALGESDLNDKKARIGERITQALYQNLIEVHVFREEFIQAQDYLVLLDEMDLKTTAETWVADQTTYISERMSGVQ